MLKFGAALILATLGGASFAQETFLGTKGDPSSSAKFESGPGFAPLLQVALVLVVVMFLLKWAAPKVLSKMNKKLVTHLDGGIRVEESASFAGGSLYIVGARHKTLLLSVGVNGVQCVADLTKESPAEEPKLFMDIVDESVTSRGADDSPPAAAVYLEEGATSSTPANEPAPDDVIAALERLRRLSS